MMRRRDLLRAMLGAVTGVWSVRVDAQLSATPIVGFLETGSPESTDSIGVAARAALTAAFRQGLKEEGYVKDRNVRFEYRWANNRYDRLAALASDLVRRRVSMIIADSVVSAAVAKAATSTIPIVFQSGADPVKLGLVASLSHPGANLTGVIMFAGGLSAKRLELLREIVPKAALIAVLVNPSNVNAEVQLSDLRDAARVIGQKLLVVNASTEDEFDAAYTIFTERRADALIVGSDPMFTNLSYRLIALAAKNAIPAIYDFRFTTAAGGLMSYGTSLTASFRQLGIYAGKILRGANPADLPVIQSTKFELVINLKTAKALGLIIPPSLLAQADEVIE
jgi:putative tryptophan/tyrosine transport system substrate-binding protein